MVLPFSIKNKPQYVGMKLGDTVIDRYNKQVTIRHACYSEIGAAFYKRWDYHKRT